MENIVNQIPNPWKGLQSYQENDIIYGRDDEIKLLYTKIANNIQTVVYGKSGIGKSSIINAGIIPRAKLDGMLPVSIRLAHTTENEQSATTPYVEQIFRRIKSEADKACAVLEEIVPHNAGHKETLWEMLHRYRIWKGEGNQRKPIVPLLLLDQFEEIFTLENDKKRVDEFFSELADLLNEIKPDYLTPADPDETDYTSSSVAKDSEAKSRNVFSRIANRKISTAPDYIETSDFRLVITLREDFLSYLERYTAYIPAMKQNRFSILPLNEEQAARIITEPIRNLIQPSVAELIIQRVTGRNDFKLDGIPEIEVNATLLSLYMEQLYERKKPSDNEITSELVVQSHDIIAKFYEDSISDIPNKNIEYLEERLVTNANRRNNVARTDLQSGGVSQEVLDSLINRKVLRQFSYGGDLRIEFIHDILCETVVNRKNQRKLNDLKKKNRLLYLLPAAIVLTSAVVLLFFWKPWQHDTLYNDNKIIPVRFFEDEIVHATNDFWRANLLIVAETPVGDDTLVNREINDRYKDSTLYISLDSVKRLHVQLAFGRSAFIDIDTILYPRDFSNNPNVWITIGKKKPKTINYSSTVFAAIDGVEFPLQNAVVIVRDKVLRSSDNGSVTIPLEEPLKENDIVYVVKEGFATVERRAGDILLDDTRIEPFQMQMDENHLLNFEKQCAELDSLLHDRNTEWNYWHKNFLDRRGFAFITPDSTHDRIVMVARVVESHGASRFTIKGLYYYINEYRKYEAMGHPHYAYRIFTGHMDRGRLKKGELEKKNFELESYNFINNRQTVTGIYQYTGIPKGDVRNSTEIIGTFGE